MITKMHNKKKNLKIAMLSMILVVSSFLSIFPAFFLNSEEISELENEDRMTNVEQPSLSIIGEDEWWNSSFYYRQLINVTNPHSETFTNFIANITFNYTTLVNGGKLNQSLKDIRIVENGMLRNYYIEIDYPKKDLATVWFETSISVVNNNTELDTYMYYGNKEANFASNYLMSKNPDGLIWYKFEGFTNGEIIDYMGNYNATVKGNPQIVGGSQQVIGDGCLELDQNDGTKDYLAMQNKYYEGHNQIPELTVCVWYKTSEKSGGEYDNWAFFDFDRSEYFNFFISQKDGKLGFSSTAAPDYNNQNDQKSETNNLWDGSWHFGCAKYDGTDKYIYIDDGQEDDVVYNPHSGNAIGVGDDADFGGRENNDDPRYGIIGDGSEATTEDGNRNNKYYHGFLDEIRYFEESLSPKRIEWIAKNYKLKTELNEIQNKEASVELIVKDVDGRAVSGAKIFMYNSTDNINYTQITNGQGYTEFTNVKNRIYNIEINYTISNGTNTYDIIVYNSSALSKTYDFTGLFYKIYIEVNLWSIDFEIEDWDYEPMGYGYVLVYNKSDYTELIANLSLNKEFGTLTFRGLNTSQDAKYYYEVYYDNADYDQPQTLVNRSYVDRTTYLNTNLNILTTIGVNETDRDERDEYFLVQERFYATGSNETHIGNTKIINTTISMSKMDDHLDKIDIYTIDSYNNISTVPIYSDEYTSETQDTIKLNITEFTDAYGLFIHIEGTNSTLKCNGIIDVSYTEMYNQYVRVNMSKLIIRVYDTLGTPDPVPNVYINIINGTQGAGEDIVRLLTNSLGLAKGIENPELDFWYLTNTKYNFSLEYFGIKDQTFNVTSDQYSTPVGKFLDEFNYTLTKAGFIDFGLQLNLENYSTQFDTIYWDSDLEWGSNFFFEVQFLSTTNALDQPPTWTPITDPDYVTWEIKDKYGDVTLFSGTMNPDTNGYFNYTIDSTTLIGDEQYFFIVYGAKKGFQDPIPASKLFTVAPKNTNLAVYNTADMSYLGDNVTLYYGEKINLTVLYTSYGVNLIEATLTYEWQFIENPVAINENPSGIYTFAIDTSIADVGTYQVKINAEKQNFSYFYNYRFDVTIINRPTSLNEDTSLLHIPKTLWVKEAYNFTFEYKDILSEPDIKLTDLDQAYYQWYEVSANGSIIGEISDKIDLLESLNATYILDFDTALKEVGDYAIFVTLQKNNYEVRSALIDLTIKKRIITFDLTATNLVQNRIKIIQGEEVYIELTLTDLSDPTDPQPITGATVVLRFGSLEYELSETENGTYIYTFTTGNINTFIAARIFTGEISITREDYISESIPLTIIVGMTEIFPGMPMFYFLLIVVGIVAVVGSLVTYRLVQQARIPTFVKKARKMKKEIKGKKAISEALLYPSKEEYLVKKLGDHWETLGLSLRDVLGVEIKKKKTIPEVTEEVKFKEPTGGEE